MGLRRGRDQIGLVTWSKLSSIMLGLRLSELIIAVCILDCCDVPNVCRHLGCKQRVCELGEGNHAKGMIVHRQALYLVLISRML